MRGCIMEDKKNDSNKGGLTVGELENHAKRYAIEISFTVIFILTAIFSFIWGGHMITWSILLSMLFAIVGSIWASFVHKMAAKSIKFFTKEKVTAISTGIVAALLSIFLPALIFAIVGLIAGNSLALHGRGICCEESKCDRK